MNSKKEWKELESKIFNFRNFVYKFYKKLKALQAEGAQHYMQAHLSIKAQNFWKP